MQTSSAFLGGRPEEFHDVLVADASFVVLVSHADVDFAYNDEKAEATVYLTTSAAQEYHSVSGGEINLSRMT